ncbi:MAG: hypothetical protein B7Z47_02060 [Chthoniobacter sp. 12-60-6]|nr:MAG: hypothetical protein B7Z47_02060 [Chthoniobacter sp. 12-60-6]
MKWFISLSSILLTQIAAYAEIIHHSKFDGDLVAAGGKTWLGKSIGYSAGVTGKAVDLKGESYISFPDDVHFSSEEGTLEMWIKTHWAGNDGKEHSLLALGKSSGLRIMKSKENELILMWKPGEHPQFGFKFSIANDWPKQEWRHLVLTWKRDSFFVYVDGIVRSGGLAEAVPAPLPETSPLYLGCTDPVPGDLMVDELILRNDALTRAEVLENYERGMSQFELRGDPRLVMRVLIDKSPATLILDTGCMLNVLFKPFATEANLKLLPSYRGGEVFNEETDATLTQIDGRSLKMRFIVLKNETGLPQQGMLGWDQFFTANRLQILWDHRAMKPLSEAETQTMTRGWQEHDFSSSLHKLMLPVVSMRIGNVEITLPLVIDTGDGTGLSFTKKVWDSLQPQLDQEKRSLSASWTPNRGTQKHIDIVPDSVEIFGKRMNGH